MDSVSLFTDEHRAAPYSAANAFKELTHEFVKIDVAEKQAMEQNSGIVIVPPKRPILDAAALALMTRCRRVFSSEEPYIESAPRLILNPKDLNRPRWDVWAGDAASKASRYLKTQFTENPLKDEDIDDIVSVITESVSNAMHGDEGVLDDDDRDAFGRKWSCSIIARQHNDFREISVSVVTGGMTMGASMMRYLAHEAWELKGRCKNMDSHSDEENQERKATFMAVNGHCPQLGSKLRVGNGLSKTRAALRALKRERGEEVRGIVISGRCVCDLVEFPKKPEDIVRLPASYTLHGALISANIRIIRG